MIYFTGQQSEIHIYVPDLALCWTAQGETGSALVSTDHYGFGVGRMFFYLATFQCGISAQEA